MKTQGENHGNRAEEIRRRRTETSHQRSKSVNSRVNNPIQTRPVTVRGSNFGTPIHRQAGTRPRRQFYVAMDSAGTELRLPAIPMLNPGWRLISGVIVIVAAIAIFSLMNSPFFHVYAVEVQGLERLSAADLQAVLALEDRSIIEINPGEVHEAIAVSFPELTDVEVKVSLPNAVTIAARERMPVLSWQTEDGTHWIDVEGSVFPARGDAGPLVTIYTDDEIPLAPLTADELAKVLDQSATPEAEAGAAPANDGQPSRASVLNSIGILPSAAAVARRADMGLLNASLQLAQKLPEGTAVVYDKNHGLGWNDSQGTQVYIGKDLENFEAKYALYQAIASTLNDQGIRPVLINVQHLNAPFYRLEQ